LQPDTSSGNGSLPATAAAGRGFYLIAAIATDVDAAVVAVLLRNGAIIYESGVDLGADFGGEGVDVNAEGVASGHGIELAVCQFDKFANVLHG
jgi:hypothetical protein